MPPGSLRSPQRASPAGFLYLRVLVAACIVLSLAVPFSIPQLQSSEGEGPPLREMPPVGMLVRFRGSQDTHVSSNAYTPTEEHTHDEAPAHTHRLTHGHHHDNNEGDTRALLQKEPDIVSVTEAKPCASVVSEARGEKPRILFVQYDDRVNNTEFSALIDINREYCRMHGYEHRYLETYRNGTLPTHYSKSFMLHEIMQKESFDVIAMIDTDAVINFMEIKIETLMSLYERKHFLVSPDPFPWTGEACTGVYFVRNNYFGKTVVNEWVQHFHPERWSKNGTGHWNCYETNGTDCEWAGVYYDQGAFVKYILKRRPYSRYVQVIKDKLFNDGNPNEAQAWILHFAGKKKRRIAHWLETRAKNTNDTEREKALLSSIPPSILPTHEIIENARKRGGRNQGFGGEHDGVTDITDA